MQKSVLHDDISLSEGSTDQRRQTILGLVGYLLIGTAAVLVPSIMPSIDQEYGAMGLSLATIGLIFPARSAGSILGNLLAGVGADFLGYTRLVWVSALLLAASLALAALAHPWLFFLFTFFLISGAQGALGTGINALVADANTHARARAMNILHGVYGVGAAVSPLIIGYLLSQGLAWRWALGGTAILWLFYSLAALALRPARAQRAAKGPSQLLDPAMLKARPFLALFVVAFIYNGVAYSLLGWVALFMQESGGFSAFYSISLISIFYVALTTGRFLCAAISERLGYGKTLLVLAVGITLTYPVVVLGSSGLWVAVGIFLTGLSLSGLFPTALAFGSRIFPERTGAVSGTISIAMTLGGMAPPLWTGVFAEWWSFQVALGINYVMVLGLLGVAIYLKKVDDREQSIRG